MVLDDVQFARRDCQHRARLGALDEPGRRQWLTIPTHLPHGRSTLIRDTLIEEPDRACRRTAGMLRQYYGASPYWPALAQSLAPVLDAFGTGRTATVAEISTRALLSLLGWQGKMLASSVLPSRPGRSQRLADLCAITGARAYVCGTGGMTYLDPVPLAAEGIAVLPFQPPMTNIWSSGRSLSSLWALAALGPQEVVARMQRLAWDHGLMAAAA
ncbi:WbqC family protein [Streptomyces celluloflavus]|uniref:WbqC family protein n=1 Tax=Streptomyces celluloflavus TaxID=58344 RepID=UPI00367644E0